ncbi:MAG: transcription termination/antitermination protein NusG [Planctomycetaceae bacterium]|jgi:transcriptional antiterminator NusG|nr:transcription termination/antitermination protein NusG [Planctomycetaceae bacterium]
MLESELEKGDGSQAESFSDGSDNSDNAVVVSESDTALPEENVVSADGETVSVDEKTVLPEEEKNAKRKSRKKTSPVKSKTKGKNKKDAVEEDKVVEPEIPKGKDWYILKVQVNREDTIKKQLEQRVKIAGLDEFFGEILVPMEKVTEIRNEKKRVVKRKLYPGYVMIYMEINDDTWFLVRETPGIGDFTGAVGKPTPMLAHEVQRMLTAEKEDPEESPKLKVGYSVGDQIKIKEGSFESLGGVVDAIDYTSGRVTVIINLFGRSTPVELEYWQIEQSAG